MKIYELGKEYNIERALEGNVIFDFYANWCGPCKNLEKTFKEVAKLDSFSDLSVIKIDVDQHQELAAAYSVRSLPTMVFLKSSKAVKTKVGNLSVPDLKQVIQETFQYAK